MMLSRNIAKAVLQGSSGRGVPLRHLRVPRDEPGRGQAGWGAVPGAAKGGEALRRSVLERRDGPGGR